MKLSFLRKKHPQFIYQSFSYQLKRNNLIIAFDFRIPPDFKFSPQVKIKNIDKKRFQKIKKETLENLIFNLGMVESLSYWKATLSPKINVEAGYLTKEQISWWQDLILKGMGQFFYENKIDFTKSNFLKIKSSQRSLNFDGPEKLQLKDRILIPLGGGKDSIVTLEILKEAEEEFKIFSLNPTEAIKKIIKIGKEKSPIVIERKIDPLLLKLNQKGYLNGHTPFSAYLTFLTALCAVIFDFKYVAFSQERSSNEGNIKYQGRIINHQYSKSFEFEKKFRDYLEKYLVKGVYSFSFLRPLYEIQIAKLFSCYPQYFSAFLSCNEAQKTYSGTKRPIQKWCGQCSKCLFVFTILYPFIEEKTLIKIFHKNLFKDQNLLPLMQELIGIKDFKPFECVGTKKESKIAFYLAWKKKKKSGGELPFLLMWFERNIFPREKNWENISKEIMQGFDQKHFLPKEFERILKKKLKKPAQTLDKF